MQRRHVLRLLALLVLLTFPTPSARAKGPAEKVTITGPLVQGTIEVTSPDALEQLDLIRLKEKAIGVAAPKGKVDRDRYYFLSYYYKTQEGTLGIFSTAYYYPDQTGGRGYLLTSSWSQLSAEAEAELQRLIQRLAPPMGASQLLPATGSTTRDVTLVLGLSGFFVLGGWLLRHRARGNANAKRMGRRYPTSPHSESRFPALF